MKKQTLANKFKSSLVALAFTLAAVTGTPTQATAQNIKNIVFVHGAFVDGSGYKGVYTELTKKGYNVTIVQNPLTSLEDDVKATKIALDKQDGPTLLAGHSWGGAVITEAGNHPKVAGLVYIAALAPDKDQSVLQQLQSTTPDPANGVTAPDENGIVYFSKEKFHAGFAADLTKEDADFMYASQGTFYAKAFATPITNPAWKNKPSYAVLATEDKAIVPDLQRSMYNHINAKITEIKASHVVYVSQSKKVAEVIIKASEEINVAK